MFYGTQQTAHELLALQKRFSDAEKKVPYMVGFLTHLTDAHFTGRRFLHGPENRVENPENLEISNKLRNRAG